MSVANAWASVHALSMFMWFNHQIVVDLRLVIDMDTLETLVLWKLPILSDVLMLHIKLTILLCCHSVLLRHVIHPFHPYPSKTNNSKHFIVLATNWSANVLVVAIVC